MKRNNRLIVLTVVIFILCVIFIDLIFNFSSILMNNYESFQSQEQQLNLNNIALAYSGTAREKSDEITLDQAKSVISIIDGKYYNIEFVEKKSISELIIKLPMGNNKYGTINKDGQFVIAPNSNSEGQKWRLLLIKSSKDFYSIFGNSVISKSFNNIPPPFYIIISNISNVDSNIALHYDYNNLTARPFENFSTQKWYISDMSVSNVFDKYGNLENQNLIDYDKVNINLKIKDETLLNLLKNSGISGTNSGKDTVIGSDTDLATSPESCKYLNKDVIENGCSGCILDNIPLDN